MPNIGSPLIAGAYESHYATTGKGGLRTVADHATRNAILQDRCEVGMQVYTENDGITWQLQSGFGDPLVDGDWVAVDTSLTGAVLIDQSTPQTIGVTGDRLAKLWVTDITVTNAIAGDITGNAGTVTNGVYTSDFPLNQDTTGKADTAGNADTVTNGVYTTGADTVYLTPGTAASTYAPITHASTHAVGGADTVFPADPDADKYLKWNDTAGAIEWADAGAGGTPTDITVADEAADTTCFPSFFTAATGDLGPKTNAGLTFNSSTSILSATGFSGPLTGNVTGDVSGNAGTVTNGVYTTNNLSVMAATSSAQLAGVISDETGSGLLVFDTSPTLVTPTLGAFTATTGLVGATANFTDWSGAQAVFSSGDTGLTNSNPIGLVCETVGSGAGSYGLWSVLETSAGSSGVNSAIGARAYVHDTAYAGTVYSGWFDTATTHAGGNNIGVYAKAAGGAVDYAIWADGGDYSFYGAAGDLYNAGNASIGGTLTVAGNVGMGIAPDSQRGLRLFGNLSAVSNSAQGVLHQHSFTATANGDNYSSYWNSYYNINTDTYTGLSFMMMRLSGQTVTKTGTGTIDNAYGLYIAGPTIGTNNYPLYVASGTSYFGGDGIVLPTNAKIDLTLPTTNTHCTGNVTDSFNAGYSSAVGDLVFFGSGGKWLEVDADAVATCQGLLGIAMEAKTDGNAMKVALPGSMVRIDAWNWTVGATLYAGETLGAMQEAIPTGADAVIKVAGVALSADVIYFNPSPDQQTVVA